ncbi:MAG TPA: tRNA pseudouridine(13) synthase TruD [Gammaproteobacteria bacterium]|nr:tRNA pseudouridine(13) synthase TruD [Gammaproteobacteria bacterium]
MQTQYDMAQLATVSKRSHCCRAVIRQSITDFIVEEVLAFTPSGEGGHVFLYIEKKGVNTAFLAQQLALFAGVPLQDVGYAGLKDRHATTRQWFSVKLEGKIAPDWKKFSSDTISIKAQHWHNKKLRRGGLLGNRFQLRLTEVKGQESDWLAGLDEIEKSGVPNYFAEQRFGHHYQNLQRVHDWFEMGKVPKRRHQKSLYLSAARSWLFNQVLSYRVQQKTWNALSLGETALLAGTKSSVFIVTESTTALAQRLATMDIHPTGPLWGKAQSPAMLTQQQEQQILLPWLAWQQQLEQLGLTMARRALRVCPQQWQWQYHKEVIELQFFLPAGSYATAVLRELATIKNARAID